MSAVEATAREVARRGCLRSAQTGTRGLGTALAPLPQMRLLFVGLAFLAMGIGCGSTSNDDGGGGAGAGGPVCDTLAPPPKLSSCAKTETQVPSSQELVIQGPVLATGSAKAAGHCFDSSSDIDDDAFWFEIADADSAVWTLGVSVPGLSNPLTVGQNIRLRYEARAGQAFSTVYELALRSESDELIAYVASGDYVGQLELPDGITVSSTETVCTTVDSCGSWSEFSIQVTTSDGSTGTVEPGTTGTIGGYRLVHAGNAQSVGPASSSCNDWNVSYVNLGVTRALQ